MIRDNNNDEYADLLPDKFCNFCKKRGIGAREALDIWAQSEDYRKFVEATLGQLIRDHVGRKTGAVLSWVYPELTKASPWRKVE